ncbi:MAG: aminomethyltransferase family protein [Gammaproteobacteria bacterium]
MNKPEYLTPVKPTPFHARTSAACNTNEWSRWAGFTVVACYHDIELEYYAVRNSTAVFDVSPLVKYRITGPGPDAARYLNRLQTRDIHKLEPGRVLYTTWCNDDGKVLDDGTVFRFAENEFRLCAQDRHLPWLLDTAIGFNVEISDVSEEIAALAVQGPTSCSVLQQLGFAGIEQLEPFAFADFELDDYKVNVSRTGFTGDLGYELWTDSAHAESLWGALMTAGEHYGIRPAGTTALDLARIEAGFILPHADFMPAEAATRHTRGRSPFELGLGWLVDFDKGYFVGRRALLKEKQGGSSYRLVGLDVESNRPAKDALVYIDKKHEVGFVTSAMWSPVCKRNLAIVTVRNTPRLREDRLWVEVYVNKELKWEKRMVRAQVARRPFFNPVRRTQTPAPDF